MLPAFHKSTYVIRRLPNYELNDDIHKMYKRIHDTRKKEATKSQFGSGHRTWKNENVVIFLIIDS